MKVFVDWSIKRGHEVLVLGDDGTTIIRHMDELILPDDCTIYLESGCPKYLIYTLINQGKIVFACRGKDTKTVRENSGTKKTDVVDAKAIYGLYVADPSLFVEVVKPATDYIKLKYLVGRYMQITNIVASMKNRLFYTEKEYGSMRGVDAVVSVLENEKKQLMTNAKPLVVHELESLNRIKGVGDSLAVRLLAQAHPAMFPTLSKYLVYCGLKGCVLKRNQKGDGKRPSYKAKTTLYLMAKGTLMHSDPVYRKLYDDCKARYAKEHPDWTKGRIHAKAMNIVATFIAKDFWRSVNRPGASHVLRDSDGVEMARLFGVEGSSLSLGQERCCNNEFRTDEVLDGF